MSGFIYFIYLFVVSINNLRKFAVKLSFPELPLSLTLYQ